jgi:hypothetical protein
MKRPRDDRELADRIRVTRSDRIADRFDRVYSEPEIRKIEATAISMMPEGLIANLTEQQTRDLLYYLSRPGQVPLPAGSK